MIIIEEFKEYAINNKNENFLTNRYYTNSLIITERALFQVLLHTG